MLCKTCKHKPACHAICGNLENYLQKKIKKRGYSLRHIRRMEESYSPDGIEDLQIRTFNRRYGKRIAVTDKLCPS